MAPPYKQTFMFPTVAKACAVSEGLVRKWVQNDPKIFQEGDQEKVGRSHTRMISYQTAAQLLIAAELSAQGVDAEYAIRGGLLFAHTDDCLAGDAKRDLGGLFKGEETYVVFCSSPHPTIRVVAGPKGAAVQDLMSKISGVEAATSITIVDVRRLLINAAPALGMERDWLFEGFTDG